jgi:hypothetical protein
MDLLWTSFTNTAMAARGVASETTRIPLHAPYEQLIFSSALTLSIIIRQEDNCSLTFDFLCTLGTWQKAL